jgi:hypothetical protein
MAGSGSNVIEEPNFYNLTGHGVAITVAMSGIDGQPQGIITLHQTFLSGIGHGQHSTSHTIRLHGSASQIQSIGPA